MQPKLLNKDKIDKYELHQKIIEPTKNTKNEYIKLERTEIKEIKNKQSILFK